jgi:hypothetical protein
VRSSCSSPHLITTDDAPSCLFVVAEDLAGAEPVPVAAMARPDLDQLVTLAGRYRTNMWKCL